MSDTRRDLTPTEPYVTPARICGWCDNLDDPASNMPCPCRAHREKTNPAPVPRPKRPYRRRTPPPVGVAPARFRTLDERRNTYVPLAVPEIDAIAAAAAERAQGRGAA